MSSTTICRIVIASALFAVAGPAAWTQSAVIATTPASKAPALPKYAVYKHFLDWIRELDKQATLAGNSDPYKFADAFAGHAGLANSDLDVLKKEANALSTDLNAVDQRASRLIAKFREQAKRASESGHRYPQFPTNFTTCSVCGLRLSCIISNSFRRLCSQLSGPALMLM